MTERRRRRELRDRARQHPPEAGVYAIRNTVTGSALVASTPNLPAMRNRFEFALATGSLSALDGRLAAEARRDGVGAFAFEVLDVVEVRPDTDPATLRAELSTLEALWREQLAGRGG